MADKSLEIQLGEQWESIGISNDFIFCKIMQEQDVIYTHFPIGVKKITA